MEEIEKKILDHYELAYRANQILYIKILKRFPQIDCQLTYSSSLFYLCGESLKKCSNIALNNIEGSTENVASFGYSSTRSKILYVLQFRKKIDNVYKQVFYDFTSLKTINWDSVMEHFRLFFSNELNDTLFSAVAPKYFKIKWDSTNCYAQKLCIRDETTAEDIKEFLSNPKRSSFNNLFVMPSNQRESFGNKYSPYYHDGKYDTSMMPFDVKCHHLIDNETDIYEVFDKVFKEDGYRYRFSEDLTRHIYINTFQQLITDYDIETIKYSLAYFMEKKNKSAKARKKLFLDKAYTNLFMWNYFATFTYDDSLNDEISFDKKLRKWLQNQSSRYGVKYMGSFERSGKGRLHFHCVMKIPDTAVRLLGLYETKYYDKKRGEMATTSLSSKLSGLVGRCDFKPIVSENDDFYIVLNYCLKYINKQNNKMLYSRGVREYCVDFINNYADHIVGSINPQSKFLLMDTETKVGLHGGVRYGDL